MANELEKIKGKLRKVENIEYSKHAKEKVIERRMKKEIIKKTSEILKI